MKNVAHFQLSTFFSLVTFVLVVSLTHSFREEVAKHNLEGDLYVAVRGNVSSQLDSSVVLKISHLSPDPDLFRPISLSPTLLVQIKRTGGIGLWFCFSPICTHQSGLFPHPKEKKGDSHAQLDTHLSFMDSCDAHIHTQTYRSSLVSDPCLPFTLLPF